MVETEGSDLFYQLLSQEYHLISLVETEGSDLFHQLLSQEYQTWYHWLRLKNQIFSINYCHRSIRPDIIGWDWRIRSFLSIIVTGVSDLISLVETEGSDLFYQLLTQEYQTWYHWLKLKDQIFSINYCHRSIRPDIIGWDWRIRSFLSIIVTGVSDLISLVETEGLDLFYQLLSQEYQTWYHWLRLKYQIFSINYCHRSIRPDIIGWDWRIRSFLSIIVTGVSDLISLAETEGSDLFYQLLSQEYQTWYHWLRLKDQIFSINYCNRSIRPDIIGWDWRIRSFLSIIVTGVSDLISLVETEGSDLFYQLLSQEYQTWYHWLRLKDQIFSINYCHRSITWYHWLRLKDQIFSINYCHRSIRPDIIGWDWKIRSFLSIIVTGVSDLVSLVETEGLDLFYQLLSQEYQTWYHWLRLKDQIFSINYWHRSIRPDIIDWKWRIRSFLSIIVTGVSDLISLVETEGSDHFYQLLSQEYQTWYHWLRLKDQIFSINYCHRSIRPDIIDWDWRIRSFLSIIVTGVSDLISLVETEGSDLFYQLLSQEYQTWYHWLRLKD